MMAPNTRVTVMAIECRTMSPSTAPNSGADRAIGSDRNRSKMPFWMSVLRFTPIVSDVNMIVCTMMPGSANSTYLPVEPAIAPPKMKTKSTVMMMGCTVTSMNCSGLRNIFVTVRLARMSESRIIRLPPRSVAVVFLGLAGERVEDLVEAGQSQRELRDRDVLGRERARRPW